jgi:hypothetical protein
MKGALLLDEITSAGFDALRAIAEFEAAILVEIRSLRHILRAEGVGARLR